MPKFLESRSKDILTRDLNPTEPANLTQENSSRAMVYTKSDKKARKFVSGPT